MQNSVLLVHCNPKSPERDEELNTWFNNFHLQQVLKTPGIVAVTRYKVSHVQMEWMTPMANEPVWPHGKHVYLNVYELDREISPREVFQALRDHEDARKSHDPDNDPVEWGPQLLYEPITHKETCVWLQPERAKVTPSLPMALWVVYSTPLPGAEEANNNWYVGQGNLRNPGFQSMVRYKLSDVQGAIDGRAPGVEGPWPYGQEENLALWELDDPLAAANSRRRSMGFAMPGPRYTWMPPLNLLRRGGEHIVYEPITTRVTSIWLKDED